MRNTVITVAVLAAVGIGGFIWYQGQKDSPEPATEVVIPEGDAVETPAPLDDAADAVGEAAEATGAAVEDAVEAAGDAMNDAAEAVGEAVEDAVETMEEAVSGTPESSADMADGVTDAADTTTGAASDAADTAVETTPDATDDITPAPATDTVEDAATTTMESTPAEATPSAETLLTPEGFDSAQVIGMIEQSDLSPLRKQVLTSAVEQAASNPALVESVIGQVQQALGL
ncbi:hypothetical protein [Actibacterium sp. D379-3]